MGIIMTNPTYTLWEWREAALEWGMCNQVDDTEWPLSAWLLAFAPD